MENIFLPFVTEEHVPPSGNPIPIRRKGDRKRGSDLLGLLIYLFIASVSSFRGVDFVNC